MASMNLPGADATPASPARSEGRSQSDAELPLDARYPYRCRGLPYSCWEGIYLIVGTAPVW
ncbi:MAG: hypothetical protein DMG25_15170 [Acidobacteria bacterium]|nr:MAG: hypothetical protein DMG25_15170 [Acidobacteriota bacterium]PYV22784.1 MAG: hypothetical protein DMG27_17435 [Acidobacteriota bacterium]